MILDKQNMFSEDQAITGTENSDNVIDLGARDALAPTPSYRAGEAMIWVQVTADFVTLTSLDIVIQSSAAENMGSPVTHFTTTVALASLVAGAKFFFPVPEGALRYMRLTYTVNGSNPGSGSAISAGITLDHPNM